MRLTSGRLVGLVAAAACGVLCARETRAEEWFSIGPFGTQLANNDVISGQTNCVAVHPHDANTLYIGASEGGVWRTTDGGANWQPLTDTQLVRKQQNGKSKGTLSIGAIAIDPQNPRNIYAGTGDPHQATGIIGPALGVFHSTDAGDSWKPTGVDLTKCGNAAMAAATVNRIVIVPGKPPTRPPVNEAKAIASVPPFPFGQPTMIFAATNMGLFVYKEDGRDCWNPLTNGLPVSGGADDLITDPYQNVFYVAFFSQGIFKSTDLTGAQWKQLTNGLPDSGIGWISLAFGGRTGIGFSQPLPLVYAGLNVNNTYRFFQTVNGGDAWTEMPSPPSDGQLDFNNAVAVGSYDSNQVYLGQIAFWRALDAGAKGGQNTYKANPPVTDQSWTPLSCCLVQPNPFRLGMDLHADNHDIQFAPYGSFIPAPEQVEMFYVANDGGIAKGRIDFNSVVTWQSLTKGLAIGQEGTIGLDPNDPNLTASGAWHNGDILTLSNPTESLAMIGGDGFQASIDAGNLIIFVNCNAGFGGSICRLTPPAPFFTNFKSETIWSDQNARKHWADPHRPGHLLRLQKDGTLFRTTIANTGTPADLDKADSWQAIQPSPGQTGAITTIAFRSRVLEETPVYYIGTDSGQVWRGSPEGGWLKLCECGAAVNAIAPDLFQNERIFVVFKGTTSPGRIKQLTRSASSTWTAVNIDGAFSPDLQVDATLSVAVDPSVQGSNGTTIYVGTEQGMYRGHLDAPPIFTTGTATTAALIGPGPFFGQWTWQRSPGVPNVRVMDIKVHQSFQGRDGSGVVRCGTWGRGIFERRENLIIFATNEKLAGTLRVLASSLNEDGPPSPLPATIQVKAQKAQLSREAPFEIPTGVKEQVSLEAPPEIRDHSGAFRFSGWLVNGKPGGTTTKVTLTINEATQAVACYEREKPASTGKAAPLRVTLTSDARQVCVPNFSHELTISWSTTDGTPPVVVRAEITFPDRHVENFGLKGFEGSKSVPMNYPGGGAIKIKMIAQDAAKQEATSEASPSLKPCK